MIKSSIDFSHAGESRYSFVEIPTPQRRATQFVERGSDTRMHRTIDTFLDGEGAFEQVHRFVIMTLKHESTAQDGLGGSGLGMILPEPGLGNGQGPSFQ